MSKKVGEILMVDRLCRRMTARRSPLGPPAITRQEGRSAWRRGENQAIQRGPMIHWKQFSPSTTGANDYFALELGLVGRRIRRPSANRVRALCCGALGRKLGGTTASTGRSILIIIRGRLFSAARRRPADLRAPRDLLCASRLCCGQASGRCEATLGTPH